MRLIRRILTWIGALTVAALLLIIYAAASFDEQLPDRMILEVDFRKVPVEDSGDEALSILRGETLTIREQVMSIARAAEDDRVLGLIATVGDRRMSLAHVQEYSAAIETFKDSGKPAIVFAESIGGMVPANGSYLLATAFDEIRLQPSGSVGLVGLSVEYPFLRGAFDSLGVVPVFGRRHEYKLAPNTFTENAFTGEHRAAVEALVGEQYSQLVSGIAFGRDVDEATVREWVDKGPHAAQAAFALGLVDELSYADEVRAQFEDVDTEFVELKTYASGLDSPEGPEIGVIYGAGMIVSGTSRYDPIASGRAAGSDTVVDAFGDAVEAGVSAIVFRVDSPGGSYVASDAIWRAMRRAQEAGVPVVVSMGAAAASGGYLVSTHADRIVAQPGSITGSIGVWAGKFVTQRFWSDLGVEWEEVSTGGAASMGSSLNEFSEDEQARFDALLDGVYDAFVSRVSDGRELSREQIDAAARGRVWTGRQAVGQGLVDLLGGFPEAISAARTESGIEASSDVSLVVYPRPKSIAEQVLEGDWEGLGASYGSGLSMVGVAQTAQKLVDLLRSGSMAWSPWIETIRF